MKHRTIREGFILRWVRKGINAKYSVPTWLWVLVSTIVGALIAGYAFISPAEVMEFLSALPFTGKLVGPLLTASGLVTMIGMGKHRVTLVKYGSFISFCLWIPVAMGFYATGGWVNIVLLPLWMLTFWGYKYLASHVRERDGF